MIFLRDLLTTRAASEPDITAFLSCWVYEELWHGEAFSRFLGAGYPLKPDNERTRWDAPYPARWLALHGSGAGENRSRAAGGNDFVVAYLMGDADGLATAQEMDAVIAALPGLEGTRLVESAVHERHWAGSAPSIGPELSHRRGSYLPGGR